MSLLFSVEQLITFIKKPIVNIVVWTAKIHRSSPQFTGIIKK